MQERNVIFNESTVYIDKYVVERSKWCENRIKTTKKPEDIGFEKERKRKQKMTRKKSRM